MRHEKFKTIRARLLAVAVASVCSSAAWAGKADVISASATKEAGGTYTIEATVKHSDEGWEHYADRFDVMAPDGTVLGERILAHPHVDEQPFTRSLSGVMIPDGITEIRVRAHDKVHGLGGAEVTVKLDR